MDDVIDGPDAHVEFVRLPKRPTIAAFALRVQDATRARVAKAIEVGVAQQLGEAVDAVLWLDPEYAYAVDIYRQADESHPRSPIAAGYVKYGPL